MTTWAEAAQSTAGGGDYLDMSEGVRNEGHLLKAFDSLEQHWTGSGSENCEGMNCSNCEQAKVAGSSVKPKRTRVYQEVTRSDGTVATAAGSFKLGNAIILARAEAGDDADKNVYAITRTGQGKKTDFKVEPLGVHAVPEADDGIPY